MKYYKNINASLYYEVHDDNSWWYWDSVKWVPSPTPWKRRKYKKFVVDVSKLEVLVVLGIKSIKEG